MCHPNKIIELYSEHGEILTAKSEKWNNKEFFVHTDVIDIWRSEYGVPVWLKGGVSLD